MDRDKRRRSLRYRLRYRAGEYFLRALIASFRWLPASAPMYVAGFVERVSFRLLRRYRKRMQDNLEHTMGEKLRSKRERRTLARQAWRNIALGVFETITALYMTNDELCARIEIKGEERLRRALARKKGVLVLSGHFGNFGIIGPRLAAQGYDFSAVAKLADERRMAALQNGYCARTGVKIIPARPRRESVTQIISALRRNEIVLLIPDELTGAGVEVDFLGRQAPAPRGPITIARRTGATVLPVFMIRDRQNRLTLHVEPEIRFVQTGDREADLSTNARLFVQEIEDMVRRYPDQWSWMGLRSPHKHKRDTSRLAS